MKRFFTRPLLIRALAGLVPVLPAISSGTLPAGSARAQSTLVSLTSETCAAQGQVGVVQSASKGLRIKHAREWTAARKGTRVSAGDSLQTRKGQSASVSICGGGTVYLNAGSEVVTRSRTEVLAQRGEVAERTANKGAQGIRTPDARAQGRGAYFDVKTQRGNSTYVVAKGTVEVKNQRGTVRATSNQEIAVRTGRAPGSPKAVDAQTALRWAAPLAEHWSILTAPDVVLGPQRLVVDLQGNIYVTDPGSTDSRVVKLSPAGKSLAIWHLSSSTSFPSGIAIDRQNNLYVTDASGDFIRKMSLDGQALATFDLQALFPRDPMSPSGIEVDAAGNMYVTDRFMDKVLKLSPDGHLLASWGSDGSAPGQFSYPADLAVDAQGNIYVADTSNYRIQKLSPTGQVLSVWNMGPASPPYDVTLDSFGNIYIAASNPERIQELAPDGHTLRIWKNEDSKPLSDPGQFDRPFGVALDARGDIYVADHYGARIEKLTRG